MLKIPLTEHFIFSFSRGTIIRKTRYIIEWERNIEIGIKSFCGTKPYKNCKFPKSEGIPVKIMRIQARVAPFVPQTNSQKSGRIRKCLALLRLQKGGNFSWYGSPPALLPGEFPLLRKDIQITCDAYLKRIALIQSRQQPRIARFR